MKLSTVQLSNNALITVTKKGAATFDIPIMNKVMVQFFTDPSDLINFIKELNSIKQWVNQEVNKQSYALKDTAIKIEYIIKD